MSNPFEPPRSDLRRAAPSAEGGDPAAPARRKLAWYEQGWVMLPLALVAVGGAIGGACGGLAWATNEKVFRAIESPPLRYLATGLISAAAVALFAILAGIFHLLLNGGP